MAAPPGFDAMKSLLPPGPEVRIEVQRGGARGGVMFSAEDEELLSQYGLAAGGIIADTIDAPTKAAFLTQIKSGACGKGTGDLVILQKDCWAVVKVIRALIQTSMRGGSQRGGGWLNTIFGGKKTTPGAAAAAGGGAAEGAAAGASGAAGGGATSEKPTYTRDPRRAQLFARRRDQAITDLRAQLFAAGADIPKILNDKKVAIDLVAQTDLGEAEMQAGLATAAAQAVRNDFGKRRQFNTARLLFDFFTDMTRKQLEYTRRIHAEKSGASGRMDAALARVTERASGVSEDNVTALLGELEAEGAAAAGGGGAEGTAGRGGAAEGATTGVPGAVPATPPAAPARAFLGRGRSRSASGAPSGAGSPVGAGTGLGVVPSAGRNRANSGASSPEATPTLRPAAPVAPAAAAVENAAVTAARTARNTSTAALRAAEADLAEEGFEMHKVRPVWLRENVSERSIPIQYNVTRSKFRGNVKKGLSYYSIYGDTPQQIAESYGRIDRKRQTLKNRQNTLKRNTEALRQQELRVKKNALARQQAQTAERTAALREAARLEREARANVRSTQTLGERFRGFFGRGGSRKAGRKSRRNNRK